MEKEKTEDQINSNGEEAVKNDVNTQDNNEESNEKSFEQKIAELEEKLIRQYAEMENQRRRYEKEKEDAFEYGGFSFAKETLNLIDNLERSKITIEKDENLKNSEGFDKIINHLDIIHKDMLSILKKNNIYPIDSIGKKLDPNLHQAMTEIEDSKATPGTILQEIQAGYMLGERLLRPALVGVSKKINPKNHEKNEKKEEK